MIPLEAIYLHIYHSTSVGYHTFNSFHYDAKQSSQSVACMLMYVQNGRTLSFGECYTKTHIVGADPYYSMIEEIEVAAGVQLFDSGGNSIKNILRKEP